MARSIGRGAAAVPAPVILVAGWLVFVAYAYPGLMTKDSFDHFAQARAGFYLDDHPPMMQALVSITDRIIVGPAGVLILQGTAFLVGVYAILRVALAARPAALAACAVLLFPPVLAPLAVIWKDCVMAGFLVLGIGALLRDHRGWRIAGLGALTVATALRYNAPAATLPLVVLLVPWRPLGAAWKHRLARVALATAAWIAITAVAFGANAALTDRSMHLWHSSLAVMDIVGTLHYAKSDLSDDALAKKLAGTPLRVQRDIHAHARSRYVSAEFLHHVYGDERMFDLPLVNAREPATPAVRAAMERAWKAVVLTRPVAYLRYRLDTFRVVLGFDEAAWARVLVVTHPYQDRAALEAMGIPTTISWFQAWTGDAMNWVSHTIVFRPYLYAFLSLLLLYVARRQRDVVALVLSGLGLEASLFLLAASPDFRYSHWMVTTTILGAVIVGVRRLEARRAAS